MCSHHFRICCYLGRAGSWSALFIQVTGAIYVSPTAHLGDMERPALSVWKVSSFSMAHSGWCHNWKSHHCQWFVWYGHPTSRSKQPSGGDDIPLLPIKAGFVLATWKWKGPLSQLEFSALLSCGFSCSPAEQHCLLNINGKFHWKSKAAFCRTIWTSSKEAEWLKGHHVGTTKRKVWCQKYSALYP